MRFITTAILGVSVIVLAIVIHYVDREPEVGGRAAALANVLVRFDTELVDRITIEKGVKKTVLVGQAGTWFFKEPEQDRVDARIAAAVLDQINHLTIVDEIVEGEAGLGELEMGLSGDNAITVTISGPKEKGAGERVENKITLGVAAPRSNTIYARRGGEETNFVVDGNPRQWLEQPLAMLRDRRIVGAPVDRIVQMVIRQSTGEIALHRTITSPPQPWAIAKPIQTWAGVEKLDELVAAISGLEISEVIRDADPAEPIPNPLPENAVVFQMMVFGFEEPLTLYLKQVSDGDGGPPLLEARVSDRPAVYRLNSTFLDELPENANDLRDRTLARIQLPYLDTIVVQSLIDPLVYLKNEPSSGGMNWSVKINNKLVPANFAEIASLVDGVNSAAIRDFASDSGEDIASFGLAPPMKRITFKMKYPGMPLEDGSPGQVQEVDRVLNLGWKKGEEQRLFANFEGEPFVYELDPSFVSLIPTHPVKWRSLNVLTLNSMRLESITRDKPGVEKLKLTYDYKRDAWGAFSNGVDVGPSLDIASARRLRERLGGLTAQGWILSLAPAYEALQTPDVTFSIVTEELDPATGESNPKTYTVKFADSGASVYYGQVEGVNDVFYIDRSAYGDLIRPVTSSRAINR
ncbi:MAG: DUF4340 domain-containing protein [Verrucomicrobiales bacterium]|nr:DUF4340 domain-containing protein [Verrucomicrobiales bacterium]